VFLESVIMDLSVRYFCIFNQVNGKSVIMFSSGLQKILHEIFIFAFWVISGISMSRFF
jgi:hypothetical protein